MSTKQITCQRCGSINNYRTQENGPHTEAICNKCGRHIKFLPKQKQNTMKTFEQLAKEHTDWSIKVYEKSDQFTAVKHLKKEVDELDAELHKLAEGLHEGASRSAVGFEYADCLLLIIDGSKRAGFSIEEILSYVQTKIAINKERKWQKQDDGTYRHV